jgi:hypothetical protein
MDMAARSRFSITEGHKHQLDLDLNEGAMVVAVAPFIW